MPELLKHWREWPARAVIGGVLLLLGAGAVAVSTAIETDPTASVRGEDAPVNTGARDQGDIRANNSPTVARNPKRGANLAVVNRVDTPQFECGLHISFDGGERWARVPVPIPRGEEPKCFAPDATYAADGRFYMSYVTLRGRGNVPHAAWILTSEDGGRHLSKPRRVIGPLAFQVRLTADPRNPRRLYLTWLQAADVGLFKFTSPGNPVRVVRSDDRGATWSHPRRVNDPARARVVAPSAAIGPRGELYVLYLDLGEDTLDYHAGHEGFGGPPYRGRFELVLARSQDGGRTWGESVVDDRIVPTERFVAFLPPFPSVAVDRRDGRVYAGFYDGRLGNPDVWVWSLPPGGSSWEGPTRVNDTPERDDTSQYLPKLAVAPDGRLDVVYYDRRSDSRDRANEVSLQSSFDDGRSFGKRVPLSSRGFDSRVGFGSERRMPDLGNRLGLVSDDSSALAVWADTRAGTVASNKQDIARAVAAFSDPSSLAEPAKDSLRYGGAALALAGLAILAWSLWKARGRAAPAPRHP